MNYYKISKQVYMIYRQIFLFDSRSTNFNFHKNSDSSFSWFT